ncbi:MAG: peptidylprolyl isomerase [Bdellovibrionota bacterium]
MSLGFLCLVAMTGASAHAASELARVNGTVITVDEFNKKYKENLQYYNQLKAPTKKGVLEDLVKREIGIQEAKKMGLDKDPDVVDRMNTVLYHALIDKKLAKDFSKILVSDQEARDFYSKYPEIRTSHIFVALRPDAGPEDDKKAYQKIKKIQEDQLSPGKMSFAEVAQGFSEGAAAAMGGDIDYQTKDRLDPAYYEAAVKLRSPGKTSGIIRSQFGYHIIKLTAIRPWEEADKGQIKRMLFEEKRNQVFEKFMNQLRSQAKVTLHPELLKD